MGTRTIAVLEVKEEKMKKVMLVIVCLLFAATSFAQQSDPSNDVGYVKLVNNGVPGLNVSLAFGLPFQFWNVVANVPQYGIESTQPSSIIGSQIQQGVTATAADNIVRQDGGQIGFRNNTGNWAGLLQTTSAMVPGSAYYYVNKTGTVRNLVLAGDVANTNGYATRVIPGTPTTLGQLGMSWRDSRTLSFPPSATLPEVGVGLLADGFRGAASALARDLVVDQIAGTSASVLADNTTWTGMATANPGRAYRIVNRPHTNGGWTYNFMVSAAAAMNSSVALPVAPAATKAPSDNGSVKMQSVKTGTVKAAGATK
jgi:hypothetical protein